MKVKSIITLGVVAIVYVIMGATAILSPHRNFALVNGGLPQPTYSTPLTGLTDSLLFESTAGIQVPISLEAMAILKYDFVSILIDDAETTFTAVEFPRALAYSGLKLDTEIIVTDKSGTSTTIPTAKLKQPGYAYIVYADANREALSGDYGHFCLYITEGENQGLIIDIVSITNLNSVG